VFPNAEAEVMECQDDILEEWRYIKSDSRTVAAFILPQLLDHFCFGVLFSGANSPIHEEYLSFIAGAS
jgi:hypothetical protein